MGTDPFILDRRSRSSIYSHAILFPILHSLLDPFPIPILFIDLIKTILFNNSKQYICRYNDLYIINL